MYKFLDETSYIALSKLGKIKNEALKLNSLVGQEDTTCVALIHYGVGLSDVKVIGGLCRF